MASSMRGTKDCWLMRSKAWVIRGSLRNRSLTTGLSVSSLLRSLVNWVTCGWCWVGGCETAAGSVKSMLRRWLISSSNWFSCTSSSIANWLRPSDNLSRSFRASTSSWASIFASSNLLPISYFSTSTLSAVSFGFLSLSCLLMAARFELDCQVIERLHDDGGSCCLANRWFSISSSHSWTFPSNTATHSAIVVISSAENAAAVDMSSTFSRSDSFNVFNFVQLPAFSMCFRMSDIFFPTLLREMDLRSLNISTGRFASSSSRDVLRGMMTL